MMEQNTVDCKKMDIKRILQILPHRYPFLLVDKIIDYDLEKKIIVGQKNVTINEAFFQGHFPEAPIMPGVLILEALAQVGAALLSLQGHGDKLAVLLSVNQAKFRLPVKPGDVMILTCEELHLSSKGGRVKATASVDQKIVVDAEIGFALVNREGV
jgi:3-hydroxyacyl-[acyl-carrier-protein] dehydratase